MDGMKPGTRSQGTSTLRLSFNTSVPAHLRGGLLEVSHVHTPAADRGNGQASLLLQKVCAEADRARKVLLVLPKPYDDGPLDQAALIEWYSAFGFDLIQTQPVALMARPPGAAPRVKAKPLAAAMGIA
jgi:predicted GNAT family acetyltransferase